MDPNAMAAMGGGMPPAMPMDPMAMGGAPMGGMPAGGIPIDPAMLGAMLGAPGGAAATPEPSIDQNLLQQSLRVADSALDLAKAQTAKADDISTQLASVLQASGSLEGIGPQDLQAMADAQAAAPSMSV